MDLEAVPEPITLHFDTEDRRLARAGVTLTRREYGDDPGWHLTLPTDVGIHQVDAALTRTSVVPARLRRLVLGWSRGSALAPLVEPVEGEDAGARRLRKPKPKRPARLLLHARLAEQVDELLLRDGHVRLDLPDGVHQFRVACRRLRAATSTFADLLDQEAIAPIRVELQWVARALGPARDVEVARERLRELMAHNELVGPVRRRVDAEYRAMARQARAGVVATLSSPRYLSLLDALDQLVTTPPWTEAAELPATTSTRFAHDDWRRLRRAVRNLDSAREGGLAELDLAFHGVRRRAKRLRYALETLEPVSGRRMHDLVKRSHDVTRLLGDLQDTVIVRRDLAAIAAAAAAGGENAFTYGRLHLGEELLADKLHREFETVWRRLEKSVAGAELK